MDATERELRVKELLQQGEALAGTENYEEAMKKFDEAEQIDPENTRVYISKAIIYVAQQNFAAAEEQISRGLILDDKNGVLYFHRGNINFYQQKFDEAKLDFERAIDLGHETKLACFQLATLYNYLRDFENALYYYNKTLQKDPFYERALLKKVEVLLRLSRNNEAYVAANDFIDKKPEFFEGYHYKFISLMALGNLEEAKLVLDKAIERFPNDLGFKYDLMMYFDTVGDFQNALLVIETYFESDPVRFRRVKADKARLLYKMRDFERAEAAAVEVLNIEFSAEMAYYVMLSRLAAADFQNAVKYAQMIKEQNNVTDKEPYYAAYYYEALAYMKAGDAERAKTAFEEAQKVLRMATIEDPGRMNLYIYRALCYKAVGDNERAIEMTDYVISLTKGEFKEAYYIRGMIYKDMGEMEKAQADFAIVTESGSPLQNFIA